MRAAVKETPGWERTQVFLNGNKLDFVIEADDEQGYIVRLVIDRNGRLVCDGDCVRTERIDGLKGKLKIVIPGD